MYKNFLIEKQSKLCNYINNIYIKINCISYINNINGREFNKTISIFYLNISKDKNNKLRF